jgi:hypothetical protein
MFKGSSREQVQRVGYSDGRIYVHHYQHGLLCVFWADDYKITKTTTLVECDRIDSRPSTIDR